MRWCVGGLLCLLALQSPAQDWSEIERSLQKIEQGLSLAESSSSGLRDYFESEKARLTKEQQDLSDEKASLESESARLQQERNDLAAWQQDLRLQETALQKRWQSLDGREARAARLEWALKIAPPAVAILVVGAYVAGRIAR